MTSRRSNVQFASTSPPGSSPSLINEEKGARLEAVSEQIRSKIDEASKMTDAKKRSSLMGEIETLKAEKRSLKSEIGVHATTGRLPLHSASAVRRSESDSAVGDPRSRFKRSESLPGSMLHRTFADMIHRERRASRSSFSANHLEPLPCEEGLVYTHNAQTKSIEVRAGTPDKLIQCLYDHVLLGNASRFVEAFMLTYRSFVSPQRLLLSLMDHFQRYIDVGGDEPEVVTLKQKMRLKIITIFKSWVDKYWDDWRDQPEMQQQYLDWLDTHVDAVGTKLVTRLREAVERNQCAIASTARARAKMFDCAPPKPLMPSKASKALSLLDVNPVEMARQLCLLESQRFRAIEPKECLGKAWQGEQSREQSPHVHAFIQRFNRMSLWIATTVLAVKKARKRGDVIGFWIAVGGACLQLKNFCGVMEVVAGLGHGAVSRLGKSWESVSKRKRALFGELKEIMSPQKSFAAYREAIHAAQPPVVPYLGLYLSDLVFLEDGNPDFLDGHLVNMSKRMSLSSVLKEIQSYQQVHYNLLPVDPIAHLISNGVPLADDALYDVSQFLEPRKGS